MDGVTFGRSGPDAKTWMLYIAATTVSGVATPGQSLMSMNALLLHVLYRLWWSTDNLSKMLLKPLNLLDQVITFNFLIKF